MGDAAEPIFSRNAMELIRVMAVAGTNINRIRAALFSQEGVWFRNDPIMAAGKVFGLEIVSTDHRGTPYDRAAASLPEKPRRAPDRVRIVAPGSCPVPAGGYKIGRLA